MHEQMVHVHELALESRISCAAEYTGIKLGASCVGIIVWWCQQSLHMTPGHHSVYVLP